MRPRAAVAALLLGLSTLAGPSVVSAQTFGSVFDGSLPQGAILVVELDRLFSESAFGRRIAAEIEAEGAAIAAENRRIEAELTEEERELTERRPSLATDEFRALADAFDKKVQTIRREQDAKVRAFGQRGDEERRAFLTAAQPVLQEILTESGASVILDRRVVFQVAPDVDITDVAITRIDATIGDGTP